MKKNKLYFCLFLLACALNPPVSVIGETEGETPAQADADAQSVLPPYLSAATAAGLDPSKLQWYDRWVTKYPNDAPPEAFMDDSAELKRVRAEMDAAAKERREAIHKDKEILPYLKALFWLHHRSPENNGTGGVKSILEAITLNPEVTEADVTDITAEFDRILLTPFTGSDGDSHNYLLTFYAETIVRHFPTRANVDRCVRIIQRSEEIGWWFPKLWTLRVLAEIGTVDTLPVAEKTTLWFTGKAINTLKGGIEEESAREAEKLLDSMRTRLTHAQTSPVDAGRTQMPVSGKTILSGEFANPILLLAGLATLSVLFLLFKMKQRN